MKTPLAIGLALACFGIGVLTGRLSDPERPDNAEGKQAAGRGHLSGVGESGSGSSAEASATAGSGGGRAVPGRGKLPAVEEVLAAIDPLDGHHTLERLAPLLSGLGAEQFQELLASIDQGTFGADRDQALQLVSEQFGRRYPRIALEWMSDPEGFRVGWRSLVMAIAALARESPDEALAAARSLENRHLISGAMSALVLSLATSQPGTLHRWLEHEDVSRYLFSQPQQMANLVKGMAANSPREALRFAESLPAGKIRQEALAELATTWAGRDPAAALAWGRSLEDSIQRRQVMRSLLGILIHTDREAVFAMLDESEGDERRDLIVSIAGGLRQREPEEGLRWAATLEDDKDLSKALTMMASAQLSAGGREQFLELVARLPDRDRKEVGASFAASWIREDPQGASDWVAGIEEPKEKASYIRHMLGTMSHNAPEIGVELITRFQSSLHGSRWEVERTFSNLARRDLKAARAAAEALVEGENRSEAIGAVVNSWTSHDPEAAASYVFDRYTSGPERREMIDKVTGHWAENDHEAALAWAGKLDGANRVAASNQMIANMAWGDHAELARETLAGLIEAHPEEASKSGRLDSAIYMVMNRAGEEDPEAGIAMINQLTNQQAQEDAIHQLMATWANSEPTEARQWLTQLGSGPVRDAAAASMAWQLSDKDSAAAFELAVSVEEGKGRSDVLMHTISDWSKTDPAAARAAVEAAELGEAERQRLLERIE